MKRPRSSRLANRHRPSPLHQSSLMRSPRRPRNTNTCPLKGYVPRHKPDSAKLYLARIARFSAYAIGCGCSKSTPIPPQIVNCYLHARPTMAMRWAAHGAIDFAARCFPERFAVEPSQDDPDEPLLSAYLQHLCVIRGFHPKTCEGLVLTARRI